MFEMKRNHVIVTVLVFMIAIAGYLSLTDKDGTKLTAPNFNAEGNNAIDVAEGGLVDHNNFFDELGELATLPPDAVNDVTGLPLTEEELAALNEDMLNEMTSPETVETSVPVGEKAVQEVVITKKGEQIASTDTTGKQVNVNFFAEEKMLREQVRAKQIEELGNYVADANIDPETQAKAAQSLIAIQDRIGKENGAESLLRAKGFKDVFVRIDETTIDVVVNDDELSDEEIAQIEEIVQRKTGCKVGQIKISRLTADKETAQN
ncbi:MAG: SpoIIIAH-like family protein [Cellulosilyticaceae bacterium]